MIYIWAFMYSYIHILNIYYIISFLNLLLFIINSIFF